MSLENEKRGQLSKELKLSTLDNILVTGSSVFIVGSVFWVPIFFIKLYKKWKQTPKEDKRRAYYRILFLSLLTLCIVGPHRKPWCGKMLKFRKWRLWKACKFNVHSSFATNRLRNFVFLSLRSL